MPGQIVAPAESPGKPRSSPSLTADIAEIERTFSLLFVPEDIFEIRALRVSEPSYRVPHTVSGYYDFTHLSDAARAVARLSPIAKGTYVTSNPVARSLLARCANRVRPCGMGDPTTSDADVLMRRWLLIDLDAVRPPGISSSDEEHTAALDLARTMRDALRHRGWPEPILGDSGNGAHLLYRIDLPRDDGGLVERCLKALAIEFGEEGVKVDTSVHNPARIWRVYGSIARKGDSTAERPHRLARLLEVPEPPSIIPRELLEALAAKAPDAGKPGPAAARVAAPGRAFNVDGWIMMHCAKYAPRGPEPWQGGRRWVFHICPFNADHSNASAYVVELSNGAIAFGCHHDSCSGKDWHALRALVEPERREKSGGRRPTPKATRLVELVKESGAELSHSADQRGYVTVSHDGIVETTPLRSSATRRLLRRLAYRTGLGAVSSQVVEDALGVLDAVAIFDGPAREVHLRVAEQDGRIFLDLADRARRIVEITPDGFSISTAAPVRFVRPEGIFPLPPPINGGALDGLREYVNVSEEGWPLVAAWLVTAMRPRGPFPILALYGEQGSAKTFTSRVLLGLVDPRKAGLRRLPRDPRGLAIAASRSHAIGFDNLSYLPAEMSDGLCCLATGQGFADRALYTDGEEVLFEASRPLILNGIVEIVRREDLLDRAMIVTCPRIPDNLRREEEALWSAFERARPSLLGALCSAVATALRRLPEIRLVTLPRMADFARWAVAAEPGLGIVEGEFLKAYARTRRAADALVIEASALAGELDTFMQHRRTWTGTATELLRELEARHEEPELKKLRGRGLPSKADRLGAALRRLAPTLRRGGIEVTQRAGRKRRIELTRIGGDDGSGGGDDGLPGEPSSPKNASRAAGDGDDGDDASLPPRPSEDLGYQSDDREGDY